MTSPSSADGLSGSSTSSATAATSSKAADDHVPEAGEELTGLVEQGVHLVADGGRVEGLQRAEQPAAVEAVAADRRPAAAVPAGPTPTA